MGKVILLTAALLVGAVFVSGVPATAKPASGRDRTVFLKDIEFSPDRITVARGTSITFRWRDDFTPHNVRSTGRPRFAGASTRQRGDASHRIVLRKPGRYRYLCTLHPGMDGRITVR